MKKYCQVLINAPKKEEAFKIARNLLKNKLVAGYSIFGGPSEYWWKNKVDKHYYYNISAFSLNKTKEKIIKETKKYHSDECPVIAFIDLDGNKEFLAWIDEYCK